MTNVTRNRRYSDYKFFLIFHLVVVYNDFIRIGNRVSQRNDKTCLNISYIAMNKASEKETCNGGI